MLKLAHEVCRVADQCDGEHNHVNIIPLFKCYHDKVDHKLFCGLLREVGIVIPQVINHN